MKKHALSNNGLVVLFCTLTNGVLVKMGYDNYLPAVRFRKSLSFNIIKLLNLDKDLYSVNCGDRGVIFSLCTLIIKTK